MCFPSEVRGGTRPTQAVPVRPLESPVTLEPILDGCLTGPLTPTAGACSVGSRLALPPSHVPHHQG